MSSFFSDSTIGMGDSDYGGSIQQPLIDWEVIFVIHLNMKDKSILSLDNSLSYLLIDLTVESVFISSFFHFMMSIEWEFYSNKGFTFKECIH